MSAVFLYPSQGLDAGSFGGTARALIEKFYTPDKRDAVNRGGGFGFETVISRIRSGKFQVDFFQASWSREKAKKDFWPAVSEATTFVMLSHVGVNDGPILNHVDTENKSLPAVDRWWQPWPSLTIKLPVRSPTKVATDLSPEGRAFWQQVGRQDRKKPLKIVLLGCESGNVYGPMVARAAQCPVYGVLHSCQAANHNTQIPNLTTIEDTGNAPSGWNRSGG